MTDTLLSFGSEAKRFAFVSSTSPMAISVKLLVLTRSLVVSEHMALAPAPRKANASISVLTFVFIISSFFYLSATRALFNNFFHLF